MIFRFNNPYPVGKFEFTCTCGTWNNIFIEPSFMGQQVFPCSDEKCKVMVYVWAQTKHWHMSIAKLKC